ncbi:beta-ketoacyl-ACP synthase, partial [Halioglobus sp.]|nr:beta-ketoacyl-ACP synthase [Halioglobus sp.]
DDANINVEEIGYVNAHGTATLIGDVAESLATESVFGRNQAISSLKGNIGHTLGACGAIEAWASINMMNENWFSPTRNLEKIDDNCGNLRYIVGSGESIKTDYVMSNNFAFGGINTSLIFKKWA